MVLISTSILSAKCNYEILLPLFSFYICLNIFFICVTSYLYFSYYIFKYIFNLRYFFVRKLYFAFLNISNFLFLSLWITSPLIFVYIFWLVNSYRNIVSSLVSFKATISHLYS